ncbi:hypothetical protein QR721_10115 [Aciduricibacillus chroicocephali]|uniref:Flagellar protein n=1 Tax=Aciduricibacillus chroicocephali TaxID=3054939 RepID=A0ABY9KT52_9BACI|nr:hypothetical protein QR721_10115 [Bacillaceae bacterium 44XB]
MELANCVRCGDVYAKGLRNICRKCYEEEEAAFKMVYKFLSVRKNRQATILEIVEATDVDEDLIIKFIKEKRLRATDFPNLTYGCEKCGNPIIEGKLCNSCRQRILDDMNEYDLITEKAEALKEAEKTKSVYYAIDKEREN